MKAGAHGSIRHASAGGGSIERMVLPWRFQRSAVRDLPAVSGRGDTWLRDRCRSAGFSGMRRLHREEPVPSRIELDVARAVVAMHGTERQDLAEAMAQALERGTTAGADDIRKERQAVLGALRTGAEPRDETQEDALLRRVYGNFTGAEVRETCEGRGPHLARLPDDAARACAPGCCTCTARSGLRNPPPGAASTSPWRAHSASATVASAPRCERAWSPKPELSGFAVVRSQAPYGPVKTSIDNETELGKETRKVAPPEMLRERTARKLSQRRETISQRLAGIRCPDASEFPCAISEAAALQEDKGTG